MFCWLLTESTVLFLHDGRHKADFGCANTDLCALRRIKQLSLSTADMFTHLPLHSLYSHLSSKHW